METMESENNSLLTLVPIHIASLAHGASTSKAAYPLVINTFERHGQIIEKQLSTVLLFMQREFDTLSKR